MPPVRSVKNQYRGINAHLHSFWQATNTWNRFHKPYMVYLVELLRTKLLPLGYWVELEESLQTIRVDQKAHNPWLELTIEDVDFSRFLPPLPPDERPSSGVRLPLRFALGPDPIYEKPYAAIAIYSLHQALEENRTLLLWIELMSPSSKTEGDNSFDYKSRREKLVKQGIIFIELDFIHDLPPTFRVLADYSTNHAGTVPYRIVMLDPHPNLREGKATVAGFNVDEPIPSLKVNISGDSIANIEFDTPYQMLFERLFIAHNLDYSTLPLNFERYSEADQTRIARRMVAVLGASAAGVDLESDAAPLPVDETISLDEALAQIERLNAERKQET